MDSAINEGKSSPFGSCGAAAVEDFPVFKKTKAVNRVVDNVASSLYCPHRLFLKFYERRSDSRDFAFSALALSVLVRSSSLSA